MEKEANVGIFRTIWQIFVLLTAVTYFGVLTKATISMGKSAADLHEKGLFDLSSWNRKLVGSTNRD